MNLPLRGVRVLDLTQVFMGPSATQVLADYGADVVKIERPAVGDIARRAIPDRAKVMNPVFLSLNRNKLSIALDLRSAEGQQVVSDLLRVVDVLVSNFRPGVMEKFGLSYSDVRRVNERIIYAIGSGFGQSGPYCHKGGQDFLAQAYTGVLWRRSSEMDPPTVPGTVLADYIGGLHLVQGILLALMVRERYGYGQIVDVSLYNSMLGAQIQEATVELMRGVELNWGRTLLTGIYPTSDGEILIVGSLSYDSNPLKRLCAALKMEDVWRRPEFETVDSLQRKSRLLGMRLRGQWHPIPRGRHSSCWRPVMSCAPRFGVSVKRLPTSRPL